MPPMSSPAPVHLVQQQQQPIPSSGPQKRASSPTKSGHSPRPSSTSSRSPLFGLSHPLLLLLLLLLFSSTLPLGQCQLQQPSIFQLMVDEPGAGIQPFRHHRRLFRLMSAQPQINGPMPAANYGRQGAKRQMKDSSASLSGFAKMDALKNNMMRALINLRRYRRAGQGQEQQA